MNLGIVIYSNDSETVWSAFRFGNFALKERDKVKVFLLGKGVECQSLDTDQYKVTDQMNSFVEGGGEIFACGICLKRHQLEGSKLCPVSSLKDMYDIVRSSDKVLTF